MRATLLVVTALAVATASPEGYYHQEYNYKTSSSSFKNNELQHKTDDQGYYSKAGDLEGRTRPKVKSNSEHSEYVNPNLQNSAGYYGTGTELSSHGNLVANGYGSGSASSGFQGSAGYNAGYNTAGASSSSLGASSGYSGSAYGGSSSYGTSIQSIVSSIQNDLQRDFVANKQYQQVNIAQLEDELKRTLSERLAEVLKQRYGTQTIREGQSYSLTEGRLEARPNYQQQELELLRKSAEESLLEKLRSEYNHRNTHQSVSSYDNQGYTNNHIQTTTYRPGTTYGTTTYRSVYPNLNGLTYPSYGVSTNTQNSHYSSNRLEYSQAPSAISLTTIASNVQADLNNRLNKILENVQNQYFSDYSRGTSLDTSSILERLRQDVRQNLTYSLEEELRRNFGSQTFRDGYMFSLGSSNQYNYNSADLENLRRQVENNLITKLNRDFEAAKKHWISTQQSSSSQYNYGDSFGKNSYGSSGSYYDRSNQGSGTYGSNIRYETTTPRYPELYYRPTAASIVPIISSGIKGGANHGTLISGSSYHEVSGAGSTSNYAELEQRLQSELSNQLKAAISQESVNNKILSYSNSDRAQYEEVYRRMLEDVQRNLTQQLQSFQSGGNFQSVGNPYSSSYGSISNDQLAQLKSNLQQSLASQLQSGLQQSFSASASYSASSSHSSSGSSGYGGSGSSDYYRQARGSDSYNQYGQYRSGGGYQVGEDCNDATHHYISKRSYGYRSRPLGLSTQFGSGYNQVGGYNGISSGSYGQTGQQIDDSESESIQPPHGTYGNPYKFEQDVGQKIDDEDTQQIENEGFDSGGYFSIGRVTESTPKNNRLRYGSDVNYGRGDISVGSNQNQIGQQIDESDNQNLEQFDSFSDSLISGHSSAGQSRFYSSVPTTQNHLRPGGYNSLTSNPSPSSTLYGGSSTQGYSHHTSSSDYGYHSAKPIHSHNYNTQLGENIEIDSTKSFETTTGTQSSSPQFDDNSKPTLLSGALMGPHVDDTEQIDVNSGKPSDIPTPGKYATSHLENKNYSATSPKYPTREQNFDDTQQVEIGLNSDDLKSFMETTRLMNRPKLPENSQTFQYGGSSSHNFVPTKKPNSIDNSFGQEIDHTGDTQLGQELDETDIFHITKITEEINNQGINPLNIQVVNPSKQESSTNNTSVIRTPDQPNETEYQTSIFNNSSNIQVVNPVRPLVDSSIKQSAANETTQTTAERHDNSDIFNNRPVSPWTKPIYYPPQSTPRKIDQEVDEGQITEALPKPRIPEENYYNFEVLNNQQSKVVIPGKPVNSYNTPDTAYSSYQLTPKYIHEDSGNTDDSQNNWYSFTTKPIQPATTPKYFSSSIHGIRYILPELQPSPQPNSVSTQTEHKVSSFPQEHSSTITEQPYFQFESGIPNISPIKPSSQIDQPGIQSVNKPVTENPFPNVPYELKTATEELQSDLNHQIDEILRGSYSYSVDVDELYKDTWTRIRKNISDVCEKIVNDKSSYEGLQKQDTVYSLERYVESLMIEKLNSKFTTYFKRELKQPLQDFGQPASINKLPLELQGLTTQLEQDVDHDIDFVIQDIDTLSKTPDEVYQQSLQKLQNDIKIKCQKLIENKFNENAYVLVGIEKDQATITLQEYMETIVIQKLKEKLNTHLRQQTISQTQLPASYFENNPKWSMPKFSTSLKPHLASTNFIQGEINSQQYPQNYDSFLQNARPDSGLGSTPSDSLPVVFSNGDRSNTQPNQPNSDSQSLFHAEREADRLIEQLRISAAKRKLTEHATTDKPNTESPYNVIQVKLENLTPEQYNLLVEAEKSLSKVIDDAVRDSITYSIHPAHLLKYELYNNTLRSLEKQVKNNFSTVIDETIEPSSANNNLFAQYVVLIKQNFDQSKIADVHKYLEIKLIKHLRAQLKRAFKIDRTDITQTTQTQYVRQPVVSEQRRRVRLENLTPKQVEVITRIDKEISENVETEIKLKVEGLSKTHASQYEVQQTLRQLQSDLRKRIDEMTLSLCEPGSKYHDMLSSNFDADKIKQVEEYLEIKVINTLQERIVHYSNRGSGFGTVTSSIVHIGSQQNGGNVVSYTSSSVHGNSYGSHSISSSSHVQMGIKGGNRQHVSFEAPVVQSQSITDNVDSLPKSSTDASNNDAESTEPTTPPASWWTKFGNKVKQGASNLKQKIRGTS